MTDLSKKRGSQVIIWGDSSEAKALCEQLAGIQIAVSAFIVPTPQPDEYFSNIIEKSYLKELQNGNFFIACAFRDRADYYESRFFMEKNGLTECQDFGDFTANPDKRFYQDGYDFMEVPIDTLDLRHKYLTIAISRFKQGKKENAPVISADTLVVNAIDLKLTTNCSYKCAHCSAATPYIRQHQDFDAAQIVNDLDKLLSVMYTPLVVILGGEPLLHPEFGEVIKSLVSMRNLNHIGRFMMLTNATVLPTIEALCDFKRLPAAEIVINDYARSNQRIKEFDALCETSGVKRYINFEGKNIWYDFGDFRECRNYSEAQLLKLRYICDASAVIYNGRFYSCCRAAALEQNALLTQDKADFVDVRNATGEAKLKDELWSYLYNRRYLTACNYCNGSHVAARQIPVGS
jgi:hypothetical protein